jgi:hypothetical protein
MGTDGVFLCAAAMTLLWLPLVLAGARRIREGDAGIDATVVARSA